MTSTVRTISDGSVYTAGKMNINADALSRNPVDSERKVDGRSVNRAIPISNSRNNENPNNEIEYFGNTNLEDEGKFFQENTQEKDIDSTCNEEINYEIIEGINNTEVNKVKIIIDKLEMSNVVDLMMLKFKNLNDIC